tara:strand:+ start:2425 stop:4191 length:1767 start_codon:yes stop_codon:yes gene_type:complete
MIKLRFLKLFFDIWNIASKKRKIEIIYVFFLMCLGSISELILVSLTAPFILALENTEFLKESQNYNLFLDFFKIQNSGQELLFVSLLFGTFALFVSLIRLLNLRSSTYLAARIGTDLSLRCFNKTLYFDYLEKVSIDSSYLLNICTREISMAVNGLNLIFRLFAGFLSSLGIIIALFNSTFYGALLISILFPFLYFILAYCSKNSLKKNSQLVLNSSRNQLKTVQDTLGLFKTIILENKYEYFMNRYKNFDRTLRISQASNQLIRLYPRYLLEGLALFVLAIVSVVIANMSNINMLVLAGTLAIGVQRLLPSLQQVYSSWSGLKGNDASIQNVLYFVNSFKTKNLNLKIKNVSTNLVKDSKFFNSKIILSKIYFKYKSHHKYVLEDINMVIKKGQKIGIKGKSGYGKSTLADIILTIIKPTKGEIKIDGINLYQNGVENIQKWRNIISCVPQDIYLANASIAENIALSFDKKEIDYNRLINASKLAKLYEYINKLPEKFETKVGERGVKLSGGQIQRIAIARAFYKGSSVLIFDEPTSSLDNATEEEVIENIYSISNNVTLIIIAHRLSTLKNCDVIYEIKNNTMEES